MAGVFVPVFVPVFVSVFVSRWRLGHGWCVCPCICPCVCLCVCQQEEVRSWPVCLSLTRLLSNVCHTDTETGGAANKVVSIIPHVFLNSN